MWIGWVIGVGRHQSLASFGHMVVAPLAGLQKSKTVWHYHQQRWNMWCSLRLFRKAFGFRTHCGRLGSLFLCLSSSPLTIMEHFLLHQMTPLTDVRSTLTSAITSYAHTLRTAILTSFTLQELSIPPISSPNHLDASSFKNMLHGLVWALAEGVCWDVACDFHQVPLWTHFFSSFIAYHHVSSLSSLIHEWTSRS